MKFKLLKQLGKSPGQDSSSLTDSIITDSAVTDVEEIIGMEEWVWLGVTPPLIRGLYELGFKTPTPIQKKAIPVTMKTGSDVIGAAETVSTLFSHASITFIWPPSLSLPLPPIPPSLPFFPPSFHVWLLHRVQERPLRLEFHCSCISSRTSTHLRTRASRGEI